MKFQQILDSHSITQRHFCPDCQHSMPILEAEPECFPSELFTGPEASADVGGRWWVVQTKPRQEKSLARRLWATSIPFYLPTIARRHQRRGRIHTAQIPLFPGYVFLKVDYHQRVTALTSNRIARCLEVDDEERLWRDLCQIQRLIASGFQITPESRIGVGTPVEVTSGPLAGLQGKVERIATGQRFYVQIDFIEKGASVLIDDCVLTPLDPVSTGHPRPQQSPTSNQRRMPTYG